MENAQINPPKKAREKKRPEDREIALTLKEKSAERERDWNLVRQVAFVYAMAGEIGVDVPRSSDRKWQPVPATGTSP